MKIKLYKDELYPVYYNDSGITTEEYEIPVDLWEKYQVTQEAFLLALSELEDCLYLVDRI